MVAATLVAAGFGYGYVRYRIDAIHTLAVKGLTPDAKATARGLPPENVLLIGNQSRACLTTQAHIAQFGNPALLSGSLSDVIMVMHLDPKPVARRCCPSHATCSRRCRPGPRRVPTRRSTPPSTTDRTAPPT